MLYVYFITFHDVYMRSRATW